MQKTGHASGTLLEFSLSHRPVELSQAPSVFLSLGRVLLLVASPFIHAHTLQTPPGKKITSDFSLLRKGSSFSGILVYLPSLLCMKDSSSVSLKLVLVSSNLCSFI